MTTDLGGAIARRPGPAIVPRLGGRPGPATLPVLVGVTVGLLPLLVPAGPGNLVAADVGIAACVAVALLWTSRAHNVVRWPYAAGMVLMMIGGALAAIVARASTTSALVLVQDGLLLLWAVTLALGRDDPAIVRAAAFTWCRVAAVYATGGVVAYLIGFTPMSGVTAKDGVRAAYTFGDPNLAGNYLVVSLFVIAACRVPRSDTLRWVAYVVITAAIAFTGSNGAALTLGIGLALVIALSQYRRHGALAGVRALVVVGLVAVAIATLVLPRVSLDTMRERASESIPLLRDSVGRSNASTSERAALLDEGYDLYLSGDVAGYGPARTKAALEASQAPYVKEAHNDYLATLLERGLIGCLGLLVLGWAVGRRCLRLVVDPVPDTLRDIVPRAWLLAVILPVMAIAAGFYEVLHFRHLWTWLGLVAAIVATRTQSEQDES
jgi:hypothetical protein